MRPRNKHNSEVQIVIIQRFFIANENKSPGGAVINISSVATMTGRTDHPGAFFFNDGYSAGNRAISSFTETWAREATSHILVNELMIDLVKHRHREQLWVGKL